MTCPNATGSCVLPSDGGCIVPKTSGTFDIPKDTFLQGFSNKVTLIWGTPLDDSTIYNCVSKKLIDGKITERALVPVTTELFDTGEKYSLGDKVLIFVRPESSTEYGEWYRFLATVDPSWTSNVDAVLYSGDLVTYDGETILFSEN